MAGRAGLPRRRAIDISLAALRHARGEMLRRGLRGVTFIAADLDEFPLPPAAYAWCACSAFSIARCSRPSAPRAARRAGRLPDLQRAPLRLHPTFSPRHMLALGELPATSPAGRRSQRGRVASGADEDDTISTFVGRKP